MFYLALKLVCVPSPPFPPPPAPQEQTAKPVYLPNCLPIHIGCVQRCQPHPYLGHPACPGMVKSPSMVWPEYRSNCLQSLNSGNSQIVETLDSTRLWHWTTPLSIYVGHEASHQWCGYLGPRWCWRLWCLYDVQACTLLWVCVFQKGFQLVSGQFLNAHHTHDLLQSHFQWLPSGNGWIGLRPGKNSLDFSPPCRFWS